uniref:Uncharacterized protein n=1 Tax=Panagrolaimus superbus TaxID=310955 RepID=A0A914Y9W8_9BILA
MDIKYSLRDELVEKGEMKANEIDALCASYKVTEIHLKFFAKYFPCRILIFDSQNSQVKKYGKWKNDDNILSLVLSVLNREYSVVVDL